MKQFVACGVAEKAFEAEATHQFDSFDVVIENDRFKAGRLHQSVDDLAEAANAGDDDWTGVINYIRFMLDACVARFHRQPIRKDEQERRDQHRCGNDQQQDFRVVPA